MLINMNKTHNAPTETGVGGTIQLFDK